MVLLQKRGRSDLIPFHEPKQSVQVPLIKTGYKMNIMSIWPLALPSYATRIRDIIIWIRLGEDEIIALIDTESSNRTYKTLRDLGIFLLFIFFLTTLAFNLTLLLPLPDPVPSPYNRLAANFVTFTGIPLILWMSGSLYSKNPKYESESAFVCLIYILLSNILWGWLLDGVAIGAVLISGINEIKYLGILAKLGLYIHGCALLINVLKKKGLIETDAKNHGISIGVISALLIVVIFYCTKIPIVQAIL